MVYTNSMSVSRSMYIVNQYTHVRYVHPQYTRSILRVYCGYYVCTVDVHIVHMLNGAFGLGFRLQGLGFRV